MAVSNMKKRFILKTLTALCVVVSSVRFYEDGDIPLLTLLLGSTNLHKNGRELTQRKASSSPCECECTTNNNETKSRGTKRKVIPYVAPGPSKVQELVPMKVLKKTIPMSKHEGLGYLDHTSLSHYYQCKPSEHSSSQIDVPKQCFKRWFLNRKTPITALVSFHGSGNTWLRYLLEQATGVFTGSIYCDSVLKLSFPGESVASGNVIVVKTHHADTTDLPKDVQLETGKQRYDKAIVLVRDPFDALVSEANRRWNENRTVNSHVGLAKETAFVSNSKWDWLVEYKGATWAFLLHTWLSQTKIPVHVVQYEKLVTNLRQELVKMVEFLGTDISEEALDCAVENGQGPFKRITHLNFDPFSQGNKAAVNRCIAQAEALLAKYNITYSRR